ncbi:hypothetical protein [Barnesiella intestinihominis]|uniref:hypothetical protein n=1 Tax=Barnesiella intestinihominis TaxID=487174 RepID=UPI003F7C0502
MAKLSQIRRLAILINKLSAVRYVPTDALVAHVENTLALYDTKIRTIRNEPCSAISDLSTKCSA